jgi:hypothetical protein
MTLSTLIKRLEGCRHQDDGLDGEIALALGYVRAWFDTTNLCEKDQKTLRECAAKIAAGKYTGTKEARDAAIASLRARMSEVAG